MRLRSLPPLLLVAVVALAACGSDDSSTADTSTTDTSTDGTDTSTDTRCVFTSLTISYG